MNYHGARKKTRKQKERDRLIEELAPIADRGIKALHRLKVECDFTTWNGIDLKKMFKENPK